MYVQVRPTISLVDRRSRAMLHDFGTRCRLPLHHQGSPIQRCRSFPAKRLVIGAHSSSFSCKYWNIRRLMSRHLPRAKQSLALHKSGPCNSWLLQCQQNVSAFSNCKPRDREASSKPCPPASHEHIMKTTSREKFYSSTQETS